MFSRPARINPAIATFAVVIAAWTAAWLLKVNAVDPAMPALTRDPGEFLFWTAAKLLVWIVPAYWLVRREHRDVFAWRQWPRALAWGAAIGALFLVSGLVQRAQTGAFVFPRLAWPLMNVLLVAPVFEEYLCRGALFGSLRRTLGFWPAGSVAALLFVGLHLPGWYFMGQLGGDPRALATTMASVFLLGLSAAFATEKSGSILGGMVVHFLNNLGR